MKKTGNFGSRLRLLVWRITPGIPRHRTHAISQLQLWRRPVGDLSPAGFFELARHIRILEREVMEVFLPAVRIQINAPLRRAEMPALADSRDLDSLFMDLADSLQRVAILDRFILDTVCIWEKAGAGTPAHVGERLRGVNAARSVALQSKITKELNALAAALSRSAGPKKAGTCYSKLLQALDNLDDALQTLAHLKVDVFFPRLVPGDPLHNMLFLPGNLEMADAREAGSAWNG